MIRWTGLAPWEFQSPFPGSLTSTFLVPRGGCCWPRRPWRPSDPGSAGGNPSSAHYDPSTTHCIPSSTHYTTSSTHYDPSSTHNAPSSTHYHPSSTDYTPPSTHCHPSSTHFGSDSTSRRLLLATTILKVDRSRFRGSDASRLCPDNRLRA